MTPRTICGWLAGFNDKETRSLINRITSTKKRWLEAHATHLLNISPKSIGDPLKDALQLMNYRLLGGVVPILPFLFLPVTAGFIVSLIISAIALFALGVLKNKEHPIRSGLEMFAIVLLANLGELLARCVDQSPHWLIPRIPRRLHRENSSSAQMSTKAYFRWTTSVGSWPGRVCSPR